MKHVFLFLQGPISPFFRELGKALELNGKEVWKINFNGGDRYFWNGDNAIDFKAPIDQFPQFITDTVKEKKITDVILYGDCRPLHKTAINVLEDLGVKIHVFEEGYFRPDWITYEEGGVNAHSSLPKDAAFYNKLPDRIYPQAVKFGSYSKELFLNSFIYYIRTVRRMYGEFKHYRHHFNVSPHLTIARWLLKMTTRKHKNLQASFITGKIIKLQYFLVPLQLCRDYQIKEHSQFSGMSEFIAQVMKSFAAHVKNSAGKNGKDHIVFKIHPLDNYPQRLEKIIARWTKKLDLKDRVFCMDGGFLPALIRNARGVVVANSTSGALAISQGVPTLALSDSIYNIPGLVFAGSLDEFWRRPGKPDMRLYNKFAGYVINNTQCNGNFYNAEGRKAAVENSLKRLLKKAHKSSKLSA